MDNLTGNQRNKIIEVSDSKSKVFEELFEITQSEYPDKEDDIYLTYKELHDELLSIRSTIVDFNEFHDTETLSELNKSASTLEVEIISHIGKMFEETQIEPVIARLSDEFIEKEPETEILITIQEQIEKQDDEVVSNLIKLEEDKEMLVVKKSETLEEIENLQSELETTTERRQQRRIETELERLKKEYIVKIQELAKTELELIDIKYDIATSTYDTMEPSTEVAHRISDSLRLQSVSEIEQSKMHYEYILSYREEELTPELQENLEMALRHSESGLNHIEKSINVKYSDALIEPADIAYIDERPEEITVVYESPEEVIEYEEEEIAEIIVTEEPEITERELPVYIQDETPRYVAEERREQFTEELIIIPDSRESVYSDENPIREITEIPQGLSYRIQIGAFRSHVPNETFKGISPILVEDIPESRWLRYVVGLFYSFENANLSLPMVRALGFHDCFVVAYYNDERIPLYRAREIENQLIASGERIREDVRTGETTTTPADLQTIHQDITETGDIFFCVQIGVYRELVSSARLYGLSPISYDRLANGLIRHFYGKFMNYNAAINEQNRIRRLGISDAFVVAYSNGRRINVSEARESLQAYEAIAEPEITDRVAEVRHEEVIRPAETIIDDKPVYFVQIGAYRRSVIPQTRQLFENIAGNNTIYEITDESTLIIYRIGRFSSYQDALEIQNAARNNGIGDAFIIAVVNGQRISVSEARRRE